MTLREKIETMEAFERGEEIEHRDRLNDMWFDSNFPAWNWKEFEYRIKPKPKKTVTIEKWLCKGEEGFIILEGDNSFQISHEYEKVKLLNTYEEELQ